MDTATLLAESKARFNHNSAKAYLKEKYDNKLIIASQNGLWKADSQTISFLSALTQNTVVLIDTFNNPVTVNRVELLNLLSDTYTTVMSAWHEEWKTLEGKR